MGRLAIWVVLVAVSFYSPFVGVAHIDLFKISDPSSLEHTLFFDLRLPRVLFAFSSGIILSLGGLIFQNIFRNSLMTPYTLGISSGAVLGAGIAIRLGLLSSIFGFATISVFGFLGAILTVFLLLYLSKFINKTHSESLLLLGIALSLFYTSALMIVFYIGSSIQNDMLIRFTMGSLSVIGWKIPIVFFALSIIFLYTIYLFRFHFQLLCISDESARLKGLDTKKFTKFMLFLSSIAIGMLVSIAGPIGFIGLIVPHIVKKLYPQSIEKNILKTAIFGGLILLFCDTITRAIPTQSELPIGIITAFIGGPFFIYLIIKRD